MYRETKAEWRFCQAIVFSWLSRKHVYSDNKNNSFESPNKSSNKPLPSKPFQESYFSAFISNILGKRMKGARNDASTSPDENKNPSKGLFRKIFKKKSNNLSFNTPKDSDDESNIIRRSRTISEFSRPVFGQADHRTLFRFDF